MNPIGARQLPEEWAEARLALIRALQQRAGFVRFTELAAQLGIEQVRLQSIAEYEPNTFVLDGRGGVVNLRNRELPPPPEPPATITDAVGAVSRYKGQLVDLHVDVETLGNGHKVLDRFVHRMEIRLEDDSVRIAEDTPVVFRSLNNHSSIAGHVVSLSRDENAIYVALEYEALPADLPAVLKVDRTRMLTMLENGIANLAEVPHCFCSICHPQGGRPNEANDPGSYRTYLNTLPAPWGQLLWGPPGSGKTHCMARLAQGWALAEPERRILVAAVSNAAVDAVTKELCAALNGTAFGLELLDSRKVVRYGYPQDPSIENEPRLFGSVELEMLTATIKQIQTDLAHLRRGDDEQAIANKKAELRRLQDQRRQLLKEHLATARIVLTTVANVLDPDGPVGAAAPWNTVLVDEISMIGAAVVLRLASLAENRLLLGGDPQQLPPIVEWNNGDPPPNVKKWVGTDPFDFAGMIDTQIGYPRLQNPDRRLSKLAKQRRCHPTIWELVSDRYPRVAIQIDQQRLSEIAALAPRPEAPVVVLDVSAPHGAFGDNLALGDDEHDLAFTPRSTCLQEGWSWRNVSTATLALQTARDLLAQDEHLSVAIITPYRAQVRYLRARQREEIPRNGAGGHTDPLSRLRIGTVHSFQGSEADVVIFDPVDGSPRTTTGALLKGPVGERLLNVAVTRARGKLIVIADKRWYGNHTGGGLMRRILFNEALQVTLPVVEPDWRTPDIQVGIESPIELTLWQAIELRKTELPEIVKQHRIYDQRGRIVSRADFAIPEKRIAIYCDGQRYHHNAECWQKDIRQTRILQNLQWKVIRFTGAEIMRDPTACVSEIIEACH